MAKLRGTVKLFPFALLPVCLFLAGCKVESNALASTDSPNEVLVAPAQIASMKIVTQPVGPQNVDDTVKATGKVAYDDQKISHVYTPVSGKVAKVFVQLGDHVKKGDPLAAIDSPEIGTASADVSKAKADVIAAEHELKRQQELLEAHATSQRDYELAADSYRKAKAELERSQQKAALFQHGDIVGQRYTLRSEIDGEVYFKAVSPGMEVAGQYGGAASELFTVGDADKVWVMADVFELDIARIKLGAKAAVSVVSFPGRVFEGKIDWISGALDKDTHATKVRCTFDHTDRSLKPEMFASVAISVEMKQALAIPPSSVLHLGDQTVVFLDRGDKNGRRRFERVPVVVDESTNPKWLTVSHGLDGGETIVTEGAIGLSGMM